MRVATNEVSVPKTGAISLLKLIEVFEQRELNCRIEMDDIVERFNKQSRTTVTEDDVRRICAVWEEERRIYRDTLSWLQTLQERR